MAILAMAASSYTAGLLRSEPGVGAVMAELIEEDGVSTAVIPPVQVVEQYPPADTIAVERYPVAYVFCEKLTNRMSEKGRAFSGTARMTIECRVSQDRSDGLEANVRVMADAVARVLTASRGNWPAGMFHDGTYEVQYAPTRRGGKNLVQTAKVTFDLHVSGN